MSAYKRHLRGLAIKSGVPPGSGRCARPFPSQPTETAGLSSVNRFTPLRARSLLSARATARLGPS
jgi:hypothetical protein